MKIQGLQKLTLLDYPEKVACTVFLPGCNFRCSFCHNASLVTNIREQSDIEEEEFFKFLKKRQGILDGVCVTGGEPLLRPEIIPFIQKIKELGYLVKLDTNGSFPEKLKYLVKEHLVDYVAMDIKNSLDAYAMTAGTNEKVLEAIQESVAFLKEGSVPYEFRTTVTRNFHKKENIESIGKWLLGAERYFLQAFVDSGDLICEGIKGYEKQEMEGFLSIISVYLPNAKIRGI